MADKSGEFDFAILVLTPDDLVESRKKQLSSPRDNVLLELGLFIGGIGRKRTFIVYDRTTEIKIPSDLAGVTFATYQTHHTGNLQAALGAPCTQIKKAIQELGLRGHGVVALQTLEGTDFDFPHVFSLAKKSVFLADQNFFDFTKPGSDDANISTIIKFLKGDAARSVQMLLCDPNYKPAVETWTSIQRGEYISHLQYACGALEDWLALPDVAGRLEVKTTTFVPLTLAFVDPDDEGVVVVIPNPYEVKWIRRACFVVSRKQDPEIFMSYWGGYKDRFENANPLWRAKPRKKNA